ncbi:MAG: HAD family hydrolase [Actinomycetaceae bacterium]|nr:HAD family hydrolase [Actinomycetaceae bacterium]
MKRLILVDIDGTLLDSRHRVPESARVALAEAERAGHTLMLCTGRSLPDVYPWLWDLGFLGIIGGAGAYVRVGADVITDRRIDGERIARINADFDRYGIAWVWQGPEAFSVSANFVEVFTAGRGLRGGSPWAEYAEQVTAFVSRGPIESASKCTFLIPAGSAVTLRDLADDIGRGLRVVPGTTQGRAGCVGEVLLDGVSKATGLHEAAAHLGLDVGQTIAIGDSINDLEVLGAAGVGIAMADAPEEVKAAADMVTSSADDGGLAAALERLGVLG